MYLKKVLIIKIGAIGDLLMTTPAIRALKKTFPEVHISFLVGRSVKEAIVKNPYIDEAIEIDDYVFFKGGLLVQVKLALKLIKKLRGIGFDTAIILHRDWKYSLLIYLSGVPERVGFKRDKMADRFLTRYVMIDGIKHHIDHYLKVVKLCGAKDHGRRMDFLVSQEAVERAKSVLKRFRAKDGRIIGIFPGGARNIKEVMDIRRWPVERYSELGERLVNNGFSVILFGSKSDLYLKKGLMNIPGVIDMIGKTSLEEAAALISMCRMVVTHDNGLMHMASAVGTPVAALFGPTDPREKYPTNKGSFYFWKNEGLECIPCYKEGVFPECETFECMKKISVAEVYEKIIERVE